MKKKVNKLDTDRMVRDIDVLVNNDWGFEIVDVKSKFTQKEAREMSAVLGKIYTISHCITCNACNVKYRLPTTKRRVK